MASNPHRVSTTQTSSRMQLRDHSNASFDPATHRRVAVFTPAKAQEAAVTSQFALHSQDLVDVMAELERCQADPRAAFVFDLAQSGRVHPLDEKDLGRHRKEKDGVFGPTVWDTPTLTAELPFTFTSPPSVAAVENALKNDIGGDNHFRFAPSRGSPEEDAKAIIQLLENIGKAKYSESGSIIHMQSPTFDRAKRWIAGWEADGMLGQSDFRMTIAPTGEIFELEYYEHHFSTTLLTGSKVWLAFPPLEYNLDLLRKAYGYIDTTATLQVPVGVLGKMQNGIAIIQKPGQTLMVPPYWSLMTFCTSASTSYLWPASSTWTTGSLSTAYGKHHYSNNPT
ncbi:hypothetical protein DDE82_005449 [Stemphylium lycopersici]|nr:hypothetical protein DDE82_005449 [Stemphylium lycopersici]